jgi:filamentous hemagglutinin family protein
MNQRRLAPSARLQPTALALAAAAALTAQLGAAPAWAQPAPPARVGPIPRAAAVPPGAPLPVLSTDAARVAGNEGRFSVTQPNANQLTVTQQSQRAIVNWDSFNIGAGRTVQFVQPATTSSTLNRIHDANPSVVQGRITANGEVLLENANGLIFGATARVDTARFVATALRTTDAAFLRGLRASNPEAGAVFAAVSDSARGGFVSFERGAEIKAAAGGDVLVFAPRVLNEGRIETPDGQTVLGAGRDVYLTASADPAQRGVIVRIQPFSGNDPGLNVVTQAAPGRYRVDANGNTVDAATAGAVERINAVVAERGSINLVALAIQQNGVLSATTAVKGRNGVVLLQAQAAVNPGSAVPPTPAVPNENILVPPVTALGSVTLGPQSRIEILPDTRPEPKRNPDDPNEVQKTTPATQFDSDTFYRSQIRIEGRDVLLEGGSRVQAPGGRIEILSTADDPGASLAVQGRGVTPPASAATDPGRIVVQAGAVLDASGQRDVALPMERHQGRLSLFQNELADSPLQRDGPLYRQELWFDMRNRPAVANVAGAYATIQRTAAELSAVGGTIALRADGAVVVDQGAKLDVSGGSLAYAAGSIRRSLVKDGTGWITADRARADVKYEAFGNSSERQNAGTAIWQTDAYPGYVEPRDAGTLEVVARRTWLGGTLAGGTAPVSPELLRLGNPFASTDPASQARAGSLVVGRDASNPVFDLRVQRESGPRPAEFFARPLEADLDTTLPARTDLGAGALQQAGFGRLDLRALNALEWTSGTTLDLGAGGSARLEAVKLDFDGTLRAAGGALELRAPALAGQAARIGLGDRARLDVAGQWLDSDRRPGTAALNGGSLSLTSAGRLDAEAGASLDVSGGAQRQGTALRTGRAGRVELRLNEQEIAADTTLVRFDDWNATLRGLDFDRGGSLVVAGLDVLTLGAGSSSVFDAGFFSAGGFGSIGLSAIGDVTLASSLDLAPQLSNWRSDLPLAEPAEGGRFVSAAVQPLAALRAPVSLSLAATRRPLRGASGAYTVAPASLTMAEGARIATEAGGSLRLAATGSLVVAGTLEAPGGLIDLTIAGARGGIVNGGTPSDGIGYDATQALWLRPTAHLSAAGTTELFTDAQGRRTGTVFGGGSVRLNAQRGWLVAEQGAVIDVRGAASPGALALAGEAMPRVVSAPAGSIALAAPEGMHLQATLRAEAADAQADGGELRIEASLNDLPAFTQGPAYPETNPVTGRGPDREIRLRGPELPPLPAFTARPGAELARVLTPGLTLLDTARLQASGFARIALRADERIAFDGNQVLAVPQSLTLNAPVIAAAEQPAGAAPSDAEVRVRAPHVALGDQRRVLPERTAARFDASTGNAVLEVQAGLIEGWGDLVFQRLKNVALNATLDSAGRLTRRDGEVRFIGVARGNGENVARGSLRFGEELQLTAGQVLATSMSEFRVAGQAPQGPGTTTTLGVFAPAGGSASLVPLSAGAALALAADEVRVDGTIRQPFGSIAVEATALRLGAAAELSVSGQGQTLPLGFTVNGRSWQYRPTGLYSSDTSDLPKTLADAADLRTLDAAPSKGIRLDAQTLDVSGQARLDASGGGELQAWEFVAGVGGTRDVLAQPGRWALLPDRREDFAPYDAEVMTSSAAAGLRAGTRIEIRQSTPGLQAGTYTLLPARYALLPGAVLVSAGAAAARTPLAEAVAADDGRWTVDARLSGLGGTAAGQPWQRWTVESQATALTRSRIDRSEASVLLAANAARLDQERPALPRDGGRLSLLASNRFEFDARLALGAGAPRVRPDNTPDGPVERAGTLEAVQRGGTLAIVDRLGADGAPDGASQLRLAALNASGAGQLVLGAVQTAPGPGSTDPTLEVLGLRTLLLASGSKLQAGEVLLAALDEVRLGAGSGIETPTHAASSDAGGVAGWALPGQGAVLVLSERADVELRRAAPTNAATGVGQLTIERNATLEGRTLRLDASGPMGLDNSLAPEVQDFGVAARRLAIGTPAPAPAPAPGSPPPLSPPTVLDGPLLERLGNLPELSFGAVESVDFYGAQSLKARRLRLDTPVVRGTGAADQTVLIEVDRLELRNSAGTTPGAASGSANSIPLEAKAGRIEIGDPASTGGDAQRIGRQRLDFGAVTLRSEGDIAFTGAGALLTSTATTLAAQRLVAQGAAEHGVDAGPATLSVEAVARAADAESPAATSQGARLTLDAGRIEQRGEIDLPAGTLTLRSRGADAPADAGTPARASLWLAEGSRTAARGVRTRPGGGGAVAFDAGRIELVAEQGGVRIDGALELDGAPLPSPAERAAGQPATGVPDAGFATAADAGTLRIAATAGALALGPSARLSAWPSTAVPPGDSQAVGRGRGGRFEADVARLESAQPGAAPGSVLDPLAAMLAQAGFDDRIALRLREGDARLESATLRAKEVSVAVDRGALALAGRIEADAAAGGVLRLWAGGDLRLDGVLSARSTRAGANGGDVQIGSRDGTLSLGAGASIDAGGDSVGDGRIALRARRDGDTGRVAIGRAAGFDAQTLRAAEVIVEAVRVYDGVTRIAGGAGGGSTLGQATLLQDGEDFVAQHGAAELERLGLAALAAASLRPGAEVRSPDTLTLAGDWNLWTDGRAAAGWLTLRATGGLDLQGSLSDGFDIVGRPTDASLASQAQAGAAWSLRLVAGADSTAADPLATRAGASANLVIANNRVVRTTAGSIELAAAGDVRLFGSGSGTQQAVVYVAGRPDAPELGAPTLALPSSAFTPQFTAQGGALRVQAGQDVIGAPANQIWGSWFYRVGNAGEFVPTAWFSGWDSFRQGLASFGGGALDVRAGGDLRHLGVASPTSGLAPAIDPEARNPVQGVAQVWNGGDVSLSAAGRISGGTALLGRGEGRIEAGRAIAAEAMPNVGGAPLPTLGLVLGLMDGRWQVRAQGDVTLGPVLDPAVLPSANVGAAPRIADSEGALFYTYTAASEVDLRSSAGHLRWRQQSDGGPVMNEYWSRLARNTALREPEQIAWTASNAPLLNLLPPRVQAHAGADLEFTPGSAGSTLFPSMQGTLAFSAGGNLRLSAPPVSGLASPVGLHISDRDRAELPSALSPTPAGRAGDLPAAALQAPTVLENIVWARLPDERERRRSPSQPLRLQAGGSLDFQREGRGGVLVSAPLPAQVHAGGDLLDPLLIVQHSEPDTVTWLVAGGNLLQGPAAVNHSIVVAGPGRLEIEAGRQLDLGSSRGLETVGNAFNRTLPAQGADILLAAGQRAAVAIDTIEEMGHGGTKTTRTAERFVERYLTAQPGGSEAAQAEAEARADAYLRALGRDPAELDAADRELRATLVAAHRTQLALLGRGDAAAVAQRQAGFVRALRAEMGLVPLVDAAAETAAYATHLARYRSLEPSRQATVAETVLRRAFVDTYLAAGQPGRKIWDDMVKARELPADSPLPATGSVLFDELLDRTLFAELGRSGGWGALVPASAPQVRTQSYGLGFSAIDLAGQGDSLRYGGDIDLVASGVRTNRGGRVTMRAPGGQINVGLPGSGDPAAAGADRPRGVVTVGESGFSALSDGDFQVNSQRVFVVGNGDVTIWSSRADIDAGRGANSAISTPPLVPARREDGSIGFDLPPVTVGSGIGILPPPTGAFDGTIGLFAPNGEVLALDAQIRAPGRITLGAQVVRGADNIRGGSVAGAAIAVPTASVAVPAAPAPTTPAATAGAGGGAAAPRARPTLLLLELLGLGPDAGDPAPAAEACEPGESAADCEARRRGAVRR